MKRILNKYNFIFLFLLVSIFGFGQQPKLVKPVGHMFQVEDAFFSKKDKYIITHSENVKLWDAFTGKLLKTFENNNKKPQEVSFLENKGHLYIAYPDSIHIIDVFTDKIIKTFKGNSFSISPDGNSITVMQINDDDPSENRNARLYDLKTSKTLHEFDILIVHHSNESNLYIGVDIGKSVLYDSLFQKIYTISEGNLVGISKNFQYIAILKDVELDIIDILSKKTLKSFSIDPISLYSVRFVPQNNLMILKTTTKSNQNGYSMQSKDTYLTGYSLSSFEVVMKFPEQKGNLEAWNVNSRFLVGSFNDKTLRIWETKTGKCLTQIKDSLGPSKTISFSKENKFLLTSSNHTAASVWDIENKRLLRRLESNSSYFKSIKFTNKENIILLNTDDEVWIWDIENGKPIFSVPTIKSRSFGDCMLSNDNSRLFIKSQKNTVATFNEGNALIIDFEEDNDYVLEVYNTETKLLEKKYPLPINYFRHAISPDGKIAIITCRDSTGYVIDINSGETLKKFNDINAYGLDFTQNGKQIVVVNSNHFSLYDSLSFEKIVSVSESNKITSYGYYPTSGSLVTVLNNRKIVIRNLIKKTLIKEINDYEDTNEKLEYNSSFRSIIFDKSGNYFCIKNIKDLSVIIIESKTGKIIKFLNFDKYPSTIFVNDKNNLLISFNEKLEEFNFTEAKLLNRYTIETENINDVKPDMSTILGHSLTEVNIFVKKNNYTKYNVYMMPGSNFIITNPQSNYYAANPNATKLLHYVTTDLKVITFEQLDVKYNRPDKVLEAIGNTNTELIDSYKRAYEKRLKKLGIDPTSFRDGYSVPKADFANRDQIEFEKTNETLKLQIKGNDSIYKLDRYNVWVNEVPVFGQKGISLKDKNSNSLDTTISLKLSQGENKIETSITNVNGTESYRMPLIVNFTPTQPIKEKTYFIGIGIDKFNAKGHNLKYSVKDIRDLAIKLKEKYGQEISIDTLFNGSVTISNVKALKKKLLETNENDKVIISYSGHGLLSKEYDYFLSTYAVDFDDPTQNGLAYDELENLLDNIPARKKLMLIDACHSGEVDKEDLVSINATDDSLKKGSIVVAYKKDEKHLGLKNSFELMQSLFVNVGKSTGATIISAAAGTQFALESNDLKNGVFTYCILEAMQKNNTIKISELKNIVSKRVEELTDGLQKPTSRNETILVDWNVW